MNQNKSITSNNQPYVLILAKAHSFDKELKALSTIGIQKTVIYHSGIEALQRLSNTLDSKTASQPMFILSHNNLDDITGKIFAQTLRLHPQLHSIPVIIVATNTSTATEKHTYGYVTLQDSYASNDLLESIKQAKEQVLTKNGFPPVDTQKFISILAQLESTYKQNTIIPKTQSTTKNPIDNNTNQNYPEFIIQITKNLHTDPENIELLNQLISSLEKIKNTTQYYTLVSKIVLSYVTREQWTIAQKINVSVLARSHHSKNILYDIAHTSIQKTDFHTAAQAIIYGRVDSTQDTLLCKTIAQGCIATLHPQTNADKILKKLIENGKTDLANILQKPIKKYIKEKGAAHKLHLENNQAILLDTIKDPLQYTIQSDHSQDIATTLHKKLAPPNFLKSFPKIQEAISICKFTWHIFRSKKL